MLSPSAGIVFSKLTFLKKIRLQEATWAEVKPKWSPAGTQKWIPKASQDGAKKEKKSEVKLREVKRGFGEAYGGSEAETKELHQSWLDPAEAVRGGKGRPVGKLPPAVR